jgi:hypothetical protein
MSTPAIITTHKLAFEVAPSPYASMELWGKAQMTEQLFRVGTCTGQWGSLKDSFYILSVVNSTPGNGHLQDVFEWFENSCKIYKRNLLVLEIMTPRFYEHLLGKRGFIELDEGKKNVVKIFNQDLYDKLLLNGNEILKKGSLRCV